MTIKTWKAEFYPVPASQCPREQAIEHSLTKWRGLRPDAIKAHGLILTDWGLSESSDPEADVDSVRIGGSTCALCERFINDDAFHHDENPCTACPLAKARDGHPCDDRAPDEERSPWHRWTSAGDPEPMIAALEKAASLDNVEGEQS